MDREPMTRDELSKRIEELFPQLADVEEREWTETPEGEPFVLIEQVGFTGLDTGAIEIVGSIPKTGLVAVYRVEPVSADGESRFKLVGLADDPAIAMQAALR